MSLIYRSQRNEVKRVWQKNGGFLPRIIRKVKMEGERREHGDSVELARSHGSGDAIRSGQDLVPATVMRIVDFQEVDDPEAAAFGHPAFDDIHGSKEVEVGTVTTPNMATFPPLMPESSSEE